MTVGLDAHLSRKGAGVGFVFGSEPSKDGAGGAFGGSLGGTGVINLVSGPSADHGGSHLKRARLRK